MNTMAQGPSDGSAIARRPAVAAAICFGLGIAAHWYAPHAPAIWVGAMAALVAAGWATHARPTSSYFIAAAILVAGLAAGQLAAFYYANDHVSAFAGDTPRLAQLELHIDHPPRVLTGPFSARYHPMPPKQVTTASIAYVLTWDGWKPASGEILVQIADPHPRLAVNQTVRVTGMLQRPAAAMNPGQFDWAAYYREQRILNSFQVAHADNIQIVRSPGPGLLETIRSSVRSLLAIGFRGRDAMDHALLRALLLGDHDPQLRDVQEQFKRTGTGHHLAISGMHVAVLGGFVFAVCRLLCTPPRLSAWLMICFVVLYGLIALPSPPVVRSVVLCTAFGVGVVSRRSTDALQLLALSVLAMLVYHPLDLYNPGFQLSFGTVLGLILLTRPMLRGMRRDPDALPMPGASPKPSLLTAVTTSLDRLIIGAFATGIVAWLVSLPLIAFHFEQLNPWAILAGIAMAPLVVAALVGGLLKVVLSLLWPGLSPTWAAAAAIPVAWMRTMVEWLAAAPLGDVPVPPPPVWLVLAFYLLMLPMLWPCHRAGLRWCLRGGRCAVLVLILFLPFATGFATDNRGPGETRVTLLAVGAGQCAVVEPPSGRTLLLDVGSTGMADLVSRCLAPYLRHRGKTSVDTVVVSHANYDHFSAVAEVVESYGVREVLTSSHFTRQASDNAAAAAMLKALLEMHRPPRELAPGDRIPIGRETYLEILWPPRGLPSPGNANDASLVIKLTHAGASILFTGDIQDAAMNALLASPEALRAEVLVAPHHGSAEKLSESFIAAVGPRAIVSSNDRTLSGKQRAFDRLISGRRLFRTHRCGAITVTFDARGQVAIKSMLQPHE